MTIAPGAPLLEEPRWFGPADHPLFGWVTWPEGTDVRGGVLLAPPIGREARAARRALHEVAIALAERGFASLRFDYDGTGDSSGNFDDPARDRAWVDSVAHAAAYLRELGAETVSAVGMRLGATILGAASQAHDLRLASVVLWDPCDTGRGYLRELGALEALRRTNVIVDPERGVETAEFVFTPDAVAALRRLSLVAEAATPLAERVLVVTREDRAASEKLRKRLNDEKVDWETTSEQAAMVDVEPLGAVMPRTTIRSIVSWLAAEPAVPGPFAVPAAASSTTLAIDKVATAVTERVVRLGPRRLFGIVTEPTVAPSGPWIVMFNVANEEHTGPSRLWVELSRRWAGLGLRCVRFDLTGLGDSPRVPGRADRTMYDLAWLEDLPEVARVLSPADPADTVFVGLCSGAYLAAEAGLALGSRGVCAINPPIGVDFLAGVATLERSRHRSVRLLAVQLKEVALRLRWVSVAIWQVVRVIMPSVFNRDVMASIAASGTDLLLLASTDDLTPFPTMPRLERFFAGRLVRPANYEVTFVEGLDHSMHAAEGRDRAIAMLAAHIEGRFATPHPGAKPVDKEGQ
ncbi:MAG TPA: hypothetical protein VIE15_02050 [Acidimicrobiales bacterium]